MIRTQPRPIPFNSTGPGALEGGTPRITADDRQLVNPDRYGAHHWGRVSYSAQQPATDTDLIGLHGTAARVPRARLAIVRESLSPSDKREQARLRRIDEQQRAARRPFADSAVANFLIAAALVAGCAVIVVLLATGA